MSRRPTYLRVVAWTGCPMRCPYCHKEGDSAVGNGRDNPSSDVLIRCLEAAHLAGIQKFKLLGGEPLARPDLPVVVAHLRAAAPTADISLITSGAVAPGRAVAALAAGMDRINVSIHGWTPQAFALRGGTAHRARQRATLLDLLDQRGLRPKLNYVYTGSGDHEDLAELLRWLRDRRATLSVLDDLNDPLASAQSIVALLRRLLGPWVTQEQEEDPHSLPTTILRFVDGLRVEVKSAQLGAYAPWGMCSTCPFRSDCREGTFALRLTADGRLLPCMHRPDQAIDLAAVAKESVQTAANAMDGWITGLLR